MINLSSNRMSVISRHSRTRTPQVQLRLTSMIDMFTILLVFLLKSYSAEGQIITISNDLRLPDSTAKKPPIASPIVIVTQDRVLLDDEQVGSLQQIFGNDELEIPELSRALASHRQIAERLGAVDASLGFKGEITVQGDKEIPFRILKKIMFTCGKAGYNNIYLAVNKQE